MNPPTSSPSPFTSVKKIIAWIALGFGALLIVTSFSSGTLRDALAGVFLGLVFIIPGAWWLYCHNRDARDAATFREESQQRQYLAGLLGDDHPDIVAGMGSADAPQRRPRHWGRVAATAFAMLVAFFIAVPTDDTATTADDDLPTTSATPEPVKVTETVVVTSTPETTSSSSRPSKPRATATRTRTSTSSTTPEPVREPVDEPAEQYERPVAPEPVPAQADTRPQGFYQAPPPAPAPAPAATYFPNCSAARAAGAAPVYIGGPGYGTHLDRDGDGVGCE